ncbi:MAG: hypothetical protein ABI895_29535 [Deltaproteobacteria bacterium]
MRSQQRERGRSFWQKLQHSKDPSRFIVFWEDSAALIGILLAFAGVLLSRQLHETWPDAAASISIGVVLCCVAVYLVYETKELLIGEGADPDVIERIRAITAGHAKVREAPTGLTGPACFHGLGARAYLPQASLEGTRVRSGTPPPSVP